MPLHFSSPSYATDVCTRSDNNRAVQRRALGRVVLWRSQSLSLQILIVFAYTTMTIGYTRMNLNRSESKRVLMANLCKQSRLTRGGGDFHYIGIYRHAAGMNLPFRPSSIFGGYHFHFKSISMVYLFFLLKKFMNR